MPRTAAIDALTLAYGSSDSSAWTCALSNTDSHQCNAARDEIQFQPMGALQMPGIPWVNRPTFQQVIQYPARRWSPGASPVRLETHSHHGLAGASAQASGIVGC